MFVYFVFVRSCRHANVIGSSVVRAFESVVDSRQFPM